MRNWAGIVGVFLVFALGMISGAALAVHIVRARTEQAILSGQAGITITEGIARRLSARLDCDERQREQIRVILFDARRDLRQARQQIAPQLRQVFGQTAQRIRAILHEDQAKKFDEVLARTREHQGLANLVPSADGSPSIPPAPGPSVP